MNRANNGNPAQQGDAAEPAIKVINENDIQTAGPLIFYVGRTFYSGAMYSMIKLQRMTLYAYYMTKFGNVFHGNELRYNNIRDRRQFTPTPFVR